MNKNEVINSYFSESPSGPKAYCIVFTMTRKNIEVTEGEPMNPELKWIMRSTEENIEKIKSLSPEFLGKRRFKEIANQFT